MVVIGFNLKKIAIEREEEIKGKINIRTKLDIKDIKQEKVDLVKDKDVLKFGFDFGIIYEPNFAKIDFEGFVLFTIEPEKTKQFLKNWKKKKEMDPEMRNIIFNTILQKCNLKALILEEDLNLPHHLPLPQLKPDQGRGYVG